jgi:hypothetical protein
VRKPMISRIIPRIIMISPSRTMAGVEFRQMPSGGDPISERDKQAPGARAAAGFWAARLTL